MRGKNHISVRYGVCIYTDQTSWYICVVYDHPVVKGSKILQEVLIYFKYKLTLNNWPWLLGHAVHEHSVKITWNFKQFKFAWTFKIQNIDDYSSTHLGCFIL